MTKVDALEAIHYERGRLLVLNQLLLPHVSTYEIVNNVKTGFAVIRDMKVRGAPAIAIVAMLSLAVEMSDPDFHLKYQTGQELFKFIQSSLEFLITARPTAVNLSTAAKSLLEIVTIKAEESLYDKEVMIQSFIQAAEDMLRTDVQNNKSIGYHGSEFLWFKCPNAHTLGLNILTHCNTGSLATGGWVCMRAYNFLL